jgi:hypothetical protein
VTLLSPADCATLNAAVADLRAWDEHNALKARAGGRRNAVIARVAADLERIANADEGRELPDVLRLFPFRETLDCYEYAVIRSDVAGLEEAREERLAAVALLTRLRGATSSIDRTRIDGAE